MPSVFDKAGWVSFRLQSSCPAFDAHYPVNLAAIFVDKSGSKSESAKKQTDGTDRNTAVQCSAPARGGTVGRSREKREGRRGGHFRALAFPFFRLQRSLGRGAGARRMGRNPATESDPSGVTKITSKPKTEPRRRAQRRPPPHPPPPGAPRGCPWRRCRWTRGPARPPWQLRADVPPPPRERLRGWQGAGRGAGSRSSAGRTARRPAVRAPVGEKGGRDAA